MKISKTCQTCECNFEGFCASHTGIGYGEKTTEKQTEMSCWQIGKRYIYRLINALPQHRRQLYHHNLQAIWETDDFLNEVENLN